MYEFDGKEFSSLKVLAEYVGINEKTLTARIRRGMSVEQACQKTDLRCRYCVDQGERNLLQEFAETMKKI